MFGGPRSAIFSLCYRYQNKLCARPVAGCSEYLPIFSPFLAQKMLDCAAAHKRSADSLPDQLLIHMTSSGFPKSEQFPTHFC